jgi:catechol 2,3-dioxygenase-like lactoylglutathione lyase family enzyme
MTDDRPLLDQVNVVVRDMDAAIAFYRRLGVEIAETAPQWAHQHRSAVLPDDGMHFDIDVTAFASQWDQGWPTGASGAVIGFRVERRETVDAIYADLVAHGAVGQQPPWDAFWGARYAVVEDPDGNAVGIMSAMDPARRSPAPDA